jgi:molybdate transport system substrate-binding protein
MRSTVRTIFICLIACLSALAQGQPQQLTAAVAGNFAAPMRALAQVFEAQTGIQLTVVTGSSGKHYAQIRQGAPFDVFFAADSERPARLEQAGLAVAGSRFTYATGQLALWSPDPAKMGNGSKILKNGDFARLAMANPRLAPYGAAAQEVLSQLGLWQALQPKIVRGENVLQAFQFVQSGAAELGFVALAQIVQPGADRAGSYWLVPESLHSPIEQQAVILKPSANAEALMRFMRSAQATEIIGAYGYSTGSNSHEPE